MRHDHASHTDGSYKQQVTFLLKEVLEKGAVLTLTNRPLPWRRWRTRGWRRRSSTNLNF
jgi:hypothetical protein